MGHKKSNNCPPDIESCDECPLVNECIAENESLPEEDDYIEEEKS